MGDVPLLALGKEGQILPRINYSIVSCQINFVNFGKVLKNPVELRCENKLKKSPIEAVCWYVIYGILKSIPSQFSAYIIFLTIKFPFFIGRFD